MLDNAPENQDCMCPNCQRARREGLTADMHRYDDIHAEDVSWRFSLFCRCSRCRDERQRLASRVIAAE